MLNVANIAVLRAVDHTLYSAGEQAYAAEYGRAAGQGGGWFELRESGATTDNVLVFEPKTSPGNWRWHRLLQGKTLDLYDAGASGEAITGNDASITASSTTVNITGGGMTSDLIGKTIRIRGAYEVDVGTGGNRCLIAEITAVPSNTTLTIDTSANETVEHANWVIADPAWDNTAFQRLIALEISWNIPAGRFCYTDSIEYKGWTSGYGTNNNTIDDIDLPSGAPVIVEVAGHGLETGDTVVLRHVEGSVKLNDVHFFITVIDSDHFSLDGTDGDDYSAWTAGTGRVDQILPAIAVKGAGIDTSFLEPMANSINGVVCDAPNCVFEDINIGPSHGSPGTEYNSFIVGANADRCILKNLKAEYTHNSGFRIGRINGQGTDQDGFTCKHVLLEGCISNDNRSGTNFELMTTPRYTNFIRCHARHADTNAYTSGRGLVRAGAESNTLFEDCDFVDPANSSSCMLMAGNTSGLTGSYSEDTTVSNCRFTIIDTNAYNIKARRVRRLSLINNIFRCDSNYNYNLYFHSTYESVTVRGGAIIGAGRGIYTVDGGDNPAQIISDGVKYIDQNVYCLLLNSDNCIYTITNNFFDAPNVTNIGSISDQLDFPRIFPWMNMHGNTYASKAIEQIGWTIGGSTPALMRPEIDLGWVRFSVVIDDDNFVSFPTPAGGPNYFNDHTGFLTVRNDPRKPYYHGYYSLYGTPEINEIYSRDADSIQWSTAAGTPTGTSGTDGKTTLFASGDGFLHIENRSGTDERWFSVEIRC